MAIAACNIEVRSDGDDRNGGGFKIGGGDGGVDHAYANNPTAFTDLACASNTTLSTTAGTFAANHVHNLIQIASGTNALAGWYEITAVAGDGKSCTIDRTCATGGNMTDGVGRVGGALATPGQASKLMNSADTAIAGHKVWVKAGTYNNSSTTVNVAGGPLDFATGVHAMYNKVMHWEGYYLARTDMAGTITIDANGNAPANGYMWRMGGNFSGSHHVTNIDLDADSQSSIDGFVSTFASYNFVDECAVSAADYGYDTVSTTRCTATSCAVGIRYGVNNLSRTISCTTGYSGNGSYTDCIASGGTRGWYGPANYIVRCLAYGCSTAGFDNSLPIRSCFMQDCIAYSCGYSFTGMENSVLINCASGKPTSGRYDSGGDPMRDINPITLSNTVGDVFVDAANGDFRLVRPELGGADGSIKLWSEALGVISQTDANRDIGPVQHADPRASDYGLTVDILKDGETVDDVTGTYEGGGTCDYPAIGHVLDGIVYSSSGLTGVLSLPTVINVKDGITYGSGNVEYTGTYGALCVRTGSLDLPLVDDVQSGVIFDNTTQTGVFGWPVITNVIDGIKYGANNTEYTGTFVCDYPDIINVRSGTEYSEGDMIGTLDLPSINDVQEDVVFDNSTKTGVLDLPLVSLVVDGTTFGANAEYTGTYEDAISPADVAAASDVRYGTPRYVGGDNGTAYIPTAANVVSGVNVDNTVGVFVVPAVSNVLDDVTFGANNTQYTGTVVLPSESDVRQGVIFGAP